MSEIYFVTLIFSLFVSSYFLLVTITNIPYIKRLRRSALTQSPLVSVLIPCRNEERKIVECVASLVNQNYKNIEIVTLDDCSDDETGKKLSELQSKYKKVIAIKGDPLPEGWVGKNWACHQLVSYANGKFLLFCDADVTYDSTLIHDAIANIQGNNSKFMTLFPSRNTSSITDKFIWSFAGWTLNSWLPLILAYRTKISFLSAGFGQFLLIDKDTYFFVGGHKAFKGTSLDDFELARAVQKSGVKWFVGVGAGRVITSGYKGFFESIKGHGRSIMPVFHNRSILMFFFWLLLLNTMWSPIATLILSLAGINVPQGNVQIAALSTVIIAISWLMSVVKIRISFLAALFYPLATASVLMAALSSYARVKRKSVEWKGRSINEYDFDSQTKNVE
jgi:chlorobactene glucosyltransferase